MHASTVYTTAAFYVVFFFIEFLTTATLWSNSLFSISNCSTFYQQMFKKIEPQTVSWRVNHISQVGIKRYDGEIS